MRFGHMYVNRPLGKSKVRLPLWLYNIRVWLAEKITPPDLIAYIRLPYDEDLYSFPICDSETGRPLFTVRTEYIRISE